MNVAGIEWRDLDPHENQLPNGSRQRRAPKHPEEEPAEEDIVELQGADAEQLADGLDIVE